MKKALYTGVIIIFLILFIMVSRSELFIDKYDNIKKSLSFLLTELNQENKSTNDVIGFEKEEPRTVSIINTDKENIARAMPIAPNLYLTVDHVISYNENKKALKVSGKLIEIIKRDFIHDLSLIKGGDFRGGVPTKEFKINKDGNSSVVINQNAFWRNIKGELKKGKVLFHNKEFSSNGMTKNNLLQISGVIEPGNSGQVVFDKNNKIIGLIVGTDVSTQSFFVTTVENIVNFLK